MWKDFRWTLGVLLVWCCAASAQTNPSTDATNQLPLPPPLATQPLATQPATQQPPIQPATSGPATLPVPPAIPEPIPPTPVTQPSEPTTGPASGPSGPTTTPQGLIPVTPPSESETNPNALHEVVVTANLNQQLLRIAPPIGAQTYVIGDQQIQNIPGGGNAPIQQVLLRAPGVVEDSFGQLHVRGEHANLTYRVNGVLLPESIVTLGGFSQEIDTHIVQTLTVTDGTLPAQFGFRTAGVVDVTTKSGASLNHDEVSIYGGSYGTVQPSIVMGGTHGNFDYFVASSFKQDGLGIENPTGNVDAIHDWTNQAKFFGYFSWRLDDTSRINLMLNGSYGTFQIPQLAGAAPLFKLDSLGPGNSANINEQQIENDYYSVISYQKTLDKFSFLVAGFSRFGSLQFHPDNVNDLIFTGVAGAITNSFLTNGIQFDAAYTLNDEHTIRFGYLGDYTSEILNTNSQVFPVDSAGAQTSTTPFQIVDNGGNWATENGIYLQDEWKLAPPLTLNYGARYDWFDSGFDKESQVSPRVNLVYKVDKLTTAHAGYAKYFVPPPVQFVAAHTIDRFAGTSNAPPNFIDSPNRAERSNYYDIGIGRQMTPEWEMDVDAFYKQAGPLIDEGQFGSAIIFSPFDYQKGRVYGTEFSTTYKQGGFSTFANFSWVTAMGENIDSSQYLIANDELGFISKNFIHLDHEGEYTVSAGAAYEFLHSRVYVDMLYGSGLRAGFANIIHEPQYYPVNVGFEHIFRPDISGLKDVRFRFDILNVFDQVYQLRNGTGVGVGAPQFGQRRSFYGGLTFEF